PTITASRLPMGNSGLVTLVGAEKVGMARSTRRLSGASRLRVSLLSLARGAAGARPSAPGRAAPRPSNAWLPGGAWHPLPSADDLDQAEGLAGALDRQLGDLADAPDVVLVVQHVRFQGVGLLGAQGVPERAVGDRDRRRAVDHLEHVLGLAPVPLLAELAAELGVGLHEHPRLGPVNAGVPGALGVDHLAVAVQGGGVLAEVPDVAAAVLGVVGAGSLLQHVAQVAAVLDHPGPDPVDHPGPVGGHEQVEGLLAVLGAGVD